MVNEQFVLYSSITSSKCVLIALTQGGLGVQNYEKYADMILERSLSMVCIIIISYLR